MAKLFSEHSLANVNNIVSLTKRKLYVIFSLNKRIVFYSLPKILKLGEISNCFYNLIYIINLFFAVLTS